MATVTITLTDEIVNGAPKVRLNTTLVRADDIGAISHAMLTAQWVRMQFEAGKIDINAAHRNLHAQLQIRAAVQKATSGNL
jgi:hypothetical protein